ncbi:unannotated protein [freshwater metagenome]|jgi:hypothetical protein|uniref:Unannotated protein n=1 Tax=freshwater metagenome TaxID=449393 RepID=A0A6J7UF04_9ZZZZ|nr:hypothetical protein [Actinomycetota bacterium]MSW16418.1 hypothetical protein [Actinomycetota bacterium]MSX44362.1 hypothetical protein [Actinomycetota bacterium]MSX85182.1 hypothetical protein [Actinomycetota bacterium]MSZ61661.1 hypothetical protein [Actinomycetota bacterium]
MPTSKVRKKKKDNYIPAEILEQESGPVESPAWLAPVMVAAFLLGLLWIVVFYISQTAYPIPNIGAWNMLVGFAFIGVGFSLATKWR